MHTQTHSNTSIEKHIQRKRREKIWIEESEYYCSRSRLLSVYICVCVCVVCPVGKRRGKKARKNGALNNRNDI